MKGAVLKIATWNVNGIRARAGEVLQWIEREQPDILCLQEIKASPDAVPEPICSMSGYWCFWHGHKGYSGVSLHLRKATFPGRPKFTHPQFAPDDDRLFTWWAPWRNQKERNIGWRIDYLLLSEDLAAEAVSCAGYREFGTSDHGPLQAMIDVPAPQYEPAPEPPPQPEKPP